MVCCMYNVGLLTPTSPGFSVIQPHAFLKWEYEDICQASTLNSFIIRADVEFIFTHVLDKWMDGYPFANFPGRTTKRHQ